MSNSSNNERYLADFTDLKAKFLSICDRDRSSGRANSALDNADYARDRIEGSDTAPMLHSGECLDLKGLVDTKTKEGPRIFDPIKEEMNESSRLLDMYMVAG